MFYQSDLSLMEEFRNGKPAAFRQIHKELSPKIYFAARQIIKDSDYAKALTNQVFNKLWDLKENFETKTNVTAFLYTSVRNASLNHLRKINQLGEVSEETLISRFPECSAPSAERQMIRAEGIAKVHAAIKALHPRCSQVMQLLFIEGLTAKQVAEKLGISENAVYTHKNVGIKQLRLSLPKDIREYFPFILLLLRFFEDYSKN